MANANDDTQVSPAETAEVSFTITVVTEQDGTISWTPGPHTQRHLAELASEGDLDEFIDVLKGVLGVGAMSIATAICVYANPTAQTGLLADLLEALVDSLLGPEVENEEEEEEEEA